MIFHVQLLYYIDSVRTSIRRFFLVNKVQRSYSQVQTPGLQTCTNKHTSNLLIFFQRIWNVLVVLFFFEILYTALLMNITVLNNNIPNHHQASILKFTSMYIKEMSMYTTIVVFRKQPKTEYIYVSYCNASYTRQYGRCRILSQKFNSHIFYSLVMII